MCICIAANFLDALSKGIIGVKDAAYACTDAFATPLCIVGVASCTITGDLTCRKVAIGLAIGSLCNIIDSVIV